MDNRPDGAVDVLTKGDNNDVDDRGLYAPGAELIANSYSSIAYS